MQTAHLITPLSPARAALIDCVQIHAVHLPVCCVVCCPEEERLCYGTMIFSYYYHIYDAKLRWTVLTVFNTP